MKKGKPTALGDTLEELAFSIADELKNGREAIVDGKPERVMPHLDDRISGFKVLASYWAVTQKLPPPDDEEKGAFGGYKDTIRDLARRNGKRSTARTNGADEH